uniref:2.5 kDa salivary protein n=1 Tax=Lutzomyia longipalpis TaxID=7200 RepID=Q5WPZ6_LUTLO|nr:2.5 KDa salivary protein [Lutzomyia longipalpis]
MKTFALIFLALAVFVLCIDGAPTFVNLLDDVQEEVEVNTYEP